MPTNQLAPLVSTIRINLAGNSFQVIMEMDGGVDDGVATLLPDGDDRTATLSWNLLIKPAREDFLSRQQNFFTETALTLERKVEKSFPRSEINRHAEG